MLYVSRRLMRNPEGARISYAEMRYGVVDTDDNIETIVTEDEICDAINKYELEVVGFPAYCGLGASGAPYQLPETKTASHLKLELLQGVKIAVYNGEIEDISWGMRERIAPVSIRLSDFGESCGDFVLYNNPDCKGERVVLILDDKLRSITDRSFRYESCVTTKRLTIWASFGVAWARRGVKFDLRELTNESIASMVYDQLFWYNNAGCAVIDSEERWNRMVEKFDYPEEIFGVIHK